MNLAFTVFLPLCSNGFQKSTEACVAFRVILEKASLVAIITRAKKVRSRSDIWYKKTYALINSRAIICRCPNFTSSAFDWKKLESQFFIATKSERDGSGSSQSSTICSHARWCADNRPISAVHNHKTQKPKAVQWMWLRRDRSNRSVTVRGVLQSFALRQAKRTREWW